MNAEDPKAAGVECLPGPLAHSTELLKYCNCLHVRAVKSDCVGGKRERLRSVYRNTNRFPLFEERHRVRALGLIQDDTASALEENGRPSEREVDQVMLHL